MNCAPCAAESNRWLDSKPSELFTEFGIAHGSGAPHDVSAAGLNDRRRARYARWCEQVRFQMDLISRTCRMQGHGDGEPGEIAVVVQLDLFELTEVAA